jgi:hypothetical protein
MPLLERVLIDGTHASTSGFESPNEVPTDEPPASCDDHQPVVHGPRP